MLTLNAKGLERWLRTLVALAEALGLVPSTHTGQFKTLGPEDLPFFSGFQTCMHVVHIHTFKHTDIDIK